MSWIRYIFRRLIGLIALLLALVAFTFFMVRLIPGDTARVLAGPDTTPAVLAHIRSEFGLDKPIWTQFAVYLKSVAHLNFGESYVTQEPVSTIIRQRFGTTLTLAGASVLLAVLLGIAGGLSTAVLTHGGKRRTLDGTFSATTSIATSVPEYVVATFAVYIFAVSLRWLPVGGTQSGLWWLLPATAIAIRPASLLARLVRVQGLDVLSQDYMRTARSKRLSIWGIYGRHALPNVASGAASAIGMTFAALLGGIVVVENVFALPGIGTSLVQAVLTHDYPVVQGIVLYMGVVVVVINVAIDSIIGLADPRSLIREA